jgi:acyl-CoA reductase-like NAD-dependent aldehyde dehydrogenase
MSAFANTGQDCCARSRMFVERNVFESFTEAFVTATRKLIVGDPSKDETQLGPMVSAAQRTTVEEYLADARTQGSKFACGGAGSPAKVFTWSPLFCWASERMNVVGAKKFLGQLFGLTPFER